MDLMHFLNMFICLWNWRHSLCVCIHSGVFISRGKEDALVTKNMVVGESVYGEKRISVEVRLYLSLHSVGHQYHTSHNWLLKAQLHSSDPPTCTKDNKVGT